MSKESKKKYRKEKTKSLTIQFYKNTEQPLIKKIDEQSNKSGYVKGLIKKDIEEGD